MCAIARTARSTASGRRTVRSVCGSSRWGRATGYGAAQRKLRRPAAPRRTTRPSELLFPVFISCFLAMYKIKHLYSIYIRIGELANLRRNMTAIIISSTRTVNGYGRGRGFSLFVAIKYIAIVYIIIAHGIMSSFKICVTIINPRRACARVTVLVNPRRACARVTVLVLSVCLSVCVCVFSLFWHLAQSGVQTALSATSARYGHEIYKGIFL